MQSKVGEKDGRKWPIAGVSFPEESLLEAGRARARRLGISFSSYVRRLLEADLRQGFIIADQATVASMNDAAINSEQEAAVKAGVKKAVAEVEKGGVVYGRKRKAASTSGKTS